MVTPQSVSPGAPSPERGWRPGDWCWAAVRVLLLLVLVAGAATTVASVRPSGRQQSDLIADLAAGRVSYLDYERGSHTVRWLDGWWRWRQTELPAHIGGDGSTAAQPQEDSTQAWLHRQVDGSGRRVAMNVRNDQQSGWWPASIPGGPLQDVTAGAGIVAFLIMLGRTRHRYANRWAWFWLFTVGQVGALLYLVLEPQPVWRPQSWPPRGRAPIRGGRGLLWAILLSIGAGLVVAGIAALGAL